jgi:hypothetical protein
LVSGEQPPKSGNQEQEEVGWNRKKAFCLPCCISGRVYVYTQSRKLLCICGGPLHPEFTLKPGKRVDVRHTCSKSLSGLHNTHTSGGKKKTSRCVSINHSAATTTEGSTTKKRLKTLKKKFK